MPSQSDVARLAKVSFMTVSRVVNNQGNVREETRQRVLQAIRELNYYPNAAARALNRNRSCGVGVFIPQNEFLFAAPYFLALTIALERGFRRMGYHLVFDSLEQDSRTDYTLLYHQRQVDGVVIISPPRKSAQLDRLVEHGIPAVVLYGHPGREELPCIDVDSRGGIRMLMEELKRLGHRRVGFLKGRTGLPVAEERYRGYLAACRELGMAEEKTLVFQGDWTARSGAEAFRRFFSLTDPPTGVLCSNDLMALGFMQEAARFGKSVPGDISLGGFNNAEYAPFLSPPLTTLGQPVDEVALAAAEILVPRMEAPREFGGTGSPSLPASPSGASVRILSPLPFWRESFGPPPSRK